MLGVHILLAVGLAAFADALSPLGVAAAFVLTYVALRLAIDVLGLRGYLRRLELGTGFALWFVAEVFKASVDVARIVLGRKVAPQPAVIALRLARADDRIATVLGCLLTLTPGTMALEYVAESGLMYIHAIDARDAATVEAGVRAIEARLLRWIDADAPPPPPPSRSPARPERSTA